MKKLDNINTKILQLLTEDSRRSYQEIADTVNLSRSAVNKRINQMIDDGTIKRFTIEHTLEKAYSILLIKSDGCNCDIIFDKLCSIKEDFIFESLYGSVDSIARIATIEHCRLYEIKNMLMQMAEVEEVKTLPVMATHVKRSKK
ncbi:Lrp/AsnC family transcriptional regulator [Orbus mooreae]|uniref:Lrp/AsnC family transcriptional regulator n=1 Tax=Orbus mooreae TaxID=3074107 RepID=UPI00370D1C95